jgi:hypothetical protein
MYPLATASTRAMPGTGARAPAARQLEGDRQGQIAERPVRGVVDHECRHRVAGEPILRPEHLGEARAESVMNGKNHARCRLNA